MLLDVCDLSLSYGQKKVLERISFALHSGEKLAIVGRSGAGKSTLLKHIYQELASTATYCSQSQGLVDNLSVFHNIYMGALARHHWLTNSVNLLLPLPKPKAEIARLCHALALDMPLSTPVSRLSGGQRQRVAIARACYQQQTVFVGDEPFSALDPVMAEQLLSWVLAKHSTSIMVLHNQHLALAHFDRIIGLKEGSIAFDLPVSALNVDDLAAFYVATSTHSSVMANNSHA